MATFKKVTEPRAPESNRIFTMKLHFHSSPNICPATQDRGEAYKTAPTYTKSNTLTAIYQDLVDTYGVPRYREANPALLTVISFPFLFGVMYGDVGHGLMLLMGAAWIFWSDAASSMPDLFRARYLVLLMGLFSVYCGSCAALESLDQTTCRAQFY